MIVVGSRLSDFTTASKTAFQHERVRVVAINVAEIDAGKLAALPLVGDARATLDELLPLLDGHRVSAAYTDSVAASVREWRAEVDRVCDVGRVISDPAPVTQAQVIGVLQETLAPADVIVCAAGSLPGDLHKLWRARDPKGYHMEYGYSCMGYEIAGGLGVKMAAPERRVYVLVGDGSYLMMAQASRASADYRKRSAAAASARGTACAIRPAAISTAPCCRSISPPTPSRSGPGSGGRTRSPRSATRWPPQPITMASR